MANGPQSPDSGNFRNTPDGYSTVRKTADNQPVFDRKTVLKVGAGLGLTALAAKFGFGRKALEAIANMNQPQEIYLNDKGEVIQTPQVVQVKFIPVEDPNTQNNGKIPFRPAPEESLDSPQMVDPSTLQVKYAVREKGGTYPTDNGTGEIVDKDGNRYGIWFKLTNKQGQAVGYDNKPLPPKATSIYVSGANVTVEQPQNQ